MAVRTIESERRPAMNKSATMWLAAIAVGVGIAATGCAERKTTVRRTTETVTQPRVVEEHTVVTPPPSDETTTIERHRRTVEEDQ
jgi:F0F1-type ATP synthase membrane subunit c/vacuolar-type H+-ATPase subunit K